MFPVIAMCGHRCGLHITATTAIYQPIQCRNHGPLRKKSLTPLAVLTGLAFSLGNNTFRHSSGIALMISTNLGTPPNPYFLEACARRTFKEIVVLDSCAFMREDAMWDVVRRRSSAWEGPVWFGGESVKQGNTWWRGPTIDFGAVYHRFSSFIFIYFFF